MHLSPHLSRSKFAGFSIVELMLAVFITMIISLITTNFAAGVFRSNTDSIMMVQLSQEMRSAIQLISRDIRRSGYSDDALARYLSTEDIGSAVALGPLDGNGNAACLQTGYENLDGGPVNAVYRLRTVDGIGRVAAHFGATATCDTTLSDSGWVDVTDPLLIDVLALEFELDASLTDIVENSASGNVIQIGVQTIRIVINAELGNNDSVNRTIVNTVQLRNSSLSV